ncbi:MAG: PTS sugar transporter subunit IIA [Erysipelotrichaceae bacterium]|jgi:mannitol/fructose-specific phosphotransferase system IIA component (Ntr-type)
MIKDYLTEESVKTNVDVDTWQEAVLFTGNTLIESGKVNEEFVRSMIDVVYKYGPYMILVPKVCFFHGEPGSNVKETCLSLSVFEKPVYFKEFANQQINCAFAFGAVDKDSHMEMIKNLVSILQDDKFIEMITHNASKEEIMKKISEY